MQENDGCFRYVCQVSLTKVVMITESGNNIFFTIISLDSKTYLKWNLIKCQPTFTIISTGLKTQKENQCKITFNK